MAYSTQIMDRISFGNLKLRIVKITDAQSAGSNLDMGFSNVRSIKAVNNTDSSDTFKESISSSVRGRVTLTPVSDNDDGLAFVWGN